MLKSGSKTQEERHLSMGEVHILKEGREIKNSRRNNNHNVH